MSTEAEAGVDAVELVGRVKRNAPNAVYRWSWEVVDRSPEALAGAAFWERGGKLLSSGATDTKLFAWWQCRRACRDHARAKLGIDQGFTFRYSASVRRGAG